MGSPFQYFIDHIPADVYDGVKKLASEKIIIFRPDTYIPNLQMQTRDYWFTIPTSIPPTIWVGKREFQFPKGCLIVFEPEVSIATKTVQPAREYLTFSIKKDFFQETALEATGKRDVKFKKVQNTCSLELLQTIAHFENEMLNFNGICPLMSQSIAVQIVIQLLRDAENNAVVEPLKSGKENNHISRAIDYMQSYYNAGITLKDIGREINLSPFYFIRLFKAQTGKTPHKYLLDIRLQQAKALLKRGVNPVEEVARLCGFINVGHFSSVFRRNVGATPSEYRRRHSI
jgi:AraC-like DNA-binding protein